MPTYQFEAMDATGQEIKDVIEASNEEDAQATIRQMGYFVTKINRKKILGESDVEERGRDFLLEIPAMRVPVPTPGATLWAFIWFVLGFLTALAVSATGM